MKADMHIYNLWNDGSYEGARYQLHFKHVTVVGNGVYAGEVEAKEYAFQTANHLELEISEVHTHDHYNAEFLL